MKTRTTTLTTTFGERQFVIPDTKPANITFKWVFSGSSYRPVVVKPTPQTILDIGANVGYAALFFKSQLPDSTIISYEPDKYAYQLLLSNIQGLPGITTHNVAVSTANQALLYPGRLDSVMSSLHCDDNTDTTGQPVTLLHPAQLPPCDILKIDAEGSDLEILVNYPHVRQASLIYAELHAQYDMISAVNFLAISHDVFYSYSHGTEQHEFSWIRRDLAHKILNHEGFISS